MAFYGALEWNYVWKFLPTEDFSNYALYTKAVSDAALATAGANRMYRVDFLLNTHDKPASGDNTATKREDTQRMAAKPKIVRLRETAAGNSTWRHYFCDETGEEVFLCTLAHWRTEFPAVP